VAEREIIAVDLPLRLDTAARLMRLVDREWPGAQIVDGPGQRVLRMSIDPEASGPHSMPPFDDDELVDGD
jgi:hypothetical protein